MGSHEGNKTKPHYNISMSRRTRKAMNLKIEPQEDSFDDDERDNIDKQKSLKQMIEGRCTLAQHFKEEEMKNQEVVLRQSEGGSDGVKLKRMVRDYARDFLSHLIKVKQEPYFRSWRKSTPISLKFIKPK